MAENLKLVENNEEVKVSDQEEKDIDREAKLREYEDTLGY